MTSQLERRRILYRYYIEDIQLESFDSIVFINKLTIIKKTHAFEPHKKFNCKHVGLHFSLFVRIDLSLSYSGKEIRWLQIAKRIMILD